MSLPLSSIQPISISLPDADSWNHRTEQFEHYLSSEGLRHTLFIKGIHAQKWGIRDTHIYLLDGRPEEQFYTGDKNVGCFLSMYVVYNVMNVLPQTHFMFMESDCRFVPDWRPRLQKALDDLPKDFDFLFVGSCCAEDKEPVHVKGDVYEYPYRGEEKWRYYPQCGHCYIVAKKAVPLLIDTQRDCANPADVSLIRYAFPKMRVFAVLPRLAEQQGTELAR